MTVTADHPAERYTALLAGINPSLTPDALRTVIEKAPPDQRAAVLTAHVTATSVLTEDVVKPVAEKAVAKNESPAATATSLSHSLTSLLGTGNLELTEAVMLTPGWRVVFAGVLVVGVFATVVGLITIGIEKSPSETVLICLTAIGFISLTGVLVLVMGYKNVKLKVGKTE